ncbi:zinc-binding dehydrogenase [Rhodococcus spelaei]|uniref:Zinc-binding dehydrogenase n=1 Tax=Rhodococcus spelaei TaxID=2546320 RepID=A0A541BAB0_9NOCA|nr:zinc-binding dehydrogenase [Rhodococcus spelaei]TQF69271.1 zinc-binding dehydrogenase [Rhodococcus spelaei]
MVTPAADGSGSPAGRRVLMHLPEGGGGAEFVAVDTARLVELPDAVDTPTAAALPLAGMVALRLVRSAPSLAGRRVLITGATGGVGQFVVQLAAARGAQVTVLARPEDDAEHLTRLGAVVVRDAVDVPDPVDVLFESVGGATAEQAITRLGRNGLVLWFGQAGGKPITLDFFELLDGRSSLTVRHFVYSDLPDADDARDLAELVRITATGVLTAEIGLLEPWSATAAALEAVRSGRLPGKVVLTIDKDDNHV